MLKNNYLNNNILQKVFGLKSYFSDTNLFGIHSPKDHKKF